MPRLVATRGQPILVTLGNLGQIDCFDELFVARVYDLSQVPFQPELIVDCGAYCGYFSAMAVGYFPSARIVAFEANPDNVPMAEAQLALLDHHVDLKPTAAYVRNGTVTFHGSGMGGCVGDAGVSTASRDVECIDFSQWLQDEAPQSLVWKLDVEGAEREILPATLPHLPPRTVCFLETHHPDALCDVLLNPYRESGFAIHEIRRRRNESGSFDYVEWRLIRG
jgi:FkbM family methyltransferase